MLQLQVQGCAIYNSEQPGRRQKHKQTLRRVKLTLNGVIPNKRMTDQPRQNEACVPIRGLILFHGCGSVVKSQTVPYTSPHNRFKTPLSSFTTYVRIMSNSMERQMRATKIQSSAQNKPPAQMLQLRLFSNQAVLQRQLSQPYQLGSYKCLQITYLKS